MTRTLLFFFFFVSSAANKFAVTGTLILALFHFVRSNPQGRSSGRASVSPALVRVARCAFVRRDTRVRKVRMVQCVRRGFPGRCRGARARVRAIEPLALDATGMLFWRRGAIAHGTSQSKSVVDRENRGFAISSSPGEARVHSQSGFSETGNRQTGNALSLCTYKKRKDSIQRR